MKSGDWSEDTSARYAKHFQIKRPANVIESPVIRALRNAVNLHDIQTALSIGCGEGGYEIAIMEHFPIAFDFNEPSEILRGSLEKNLRDRRGPGRTGEIFDMPFEKLSTSKRYDLIVGFHSFYFLANPLEGVKKAFELLNPGGHLVIVLDRKDGIGQRLKEELDHAGVHGGLTAEDLFEKLNVPGEFVNIDVSWPREALIEGEALSAKGRESVAFFAFRDESTLTPEDIRRARQIIDRYSDADLVKSRNGMIHLRAIPD